MPLPSSGTLRLNDVIAEFGGGNSLRDFLRGGAYVPDTATNSGVPTSGTIRLRDLLGASSEVDTPDLTVGNVAGTENRSGPTAPSSLVVTSSLADPQNYVLPITWSYVSGDSNISLVSPAGTARSSWSASVARNFSRVATWKITDSTGASDNCTITLTYNWLDIQ